MSSAVNVVVIIYSSQKGEKPMKCPNCKTEIGENDLACPKCKKVLRLKCSNCGNVTKNTVCEKCGSVILNKCYKCGKLNSTALEICQNCGMDINASIGLRESVIEEFAVLTIDITNFDDIKSAFKSEKIKNQFRTNLYSLIKKTAYQKKLRTQFLDNTFIIRFCKDYSFVESCKSAIDFSIFVAQSITEINQKLFDAKGIALKVQMAIQKRDIYSKPSDYKSGVNINVVYSSSGVSAVFNNIEAIVDSYVYQATKDEYPYQSLSALYIKNQMVMFFELVLQKIIKLEKKKDLKAVELPKYADYEPEEDTDESVLINFSGLNCTFLKTKEESVISELKKIKNKNIQNPIVSLKGDKRNVKLSNISNSSLEEIFEGCKVIRFSCFDRNKYCAYGLLKQIVLAYYNINETESLLNPQNTDSLVTDKNLKDLINMSPTNKSHPEDVRFGYFESFRDFITAIPFKTIFVIENIEYIDECSLEILKYIVENKFLGNTGFLVSNSTDFSLHRKIPKLMTSNNYFEIELTPSANKVIVTNLIDKLKNIKDSFFLEKVLENTKGSHLYFDQAVKYLLDDGIIELKNNVYNIKEERMIVIPKDIDELVQKRILHLQYLENSFELFGLMLLIGEKVPLQLIQQLGIPNFAKILKYLEEEDFVSHLENKEVFIKHYNLYKQNFINICDKDKLKELSTILLEKIYINITAPNVVKAELLEYAKLKKEAFTQWHSLAMVSSQLGDFCAYLNCTNKFLSLVDNVIDENTDKTIDQIKMDVYFELSLMLYKYYPDKIMNFLELFLDKLEKEKDDPKIQEIANKLVQSCILSGNYRNALDYIGKIISRMPKSSFNPNDKNFNINYFLVNLVTLEIYFNLGRLNECIELGDELFKNINPKTDLEKLLPENLSKKQFDDAILDALFFMNASCIIQLKDDRKEKLTKTIEKLPQNYSCFTLLGLLSDLIEGKNITPALSQIAKAGFNDKYSEILMPIIQGIIALKENNFDALGNYIYNAKIKAADMYLHQFKYFCDLMIGYAYLNLGNIKKAKQIFYDVLDISTEKSMKNTTYMSWFLTAKAEYADKNTGIAAEILENSILKMEKDTDVSVLFMILFKALSSEIILTTGQNKHFEQALYNCEQIFDMSVKHKIYLYLPQIADMLMFIYNQILSSNQPKETTEIIQKKILNLQQTMTSIFNISEKK